MGTPDLTAPVCLRDRVYGDVCFTEPLLIALYHAPTVQRLAGIYQGGVTAFIRPERGATRLEHSVGVAALLRALGADVTEQAAGLLHDTPHTAFSHVIDFVFPNQDHDYHETHREAFLAHSELPALLAQHALDWGWVTETEHFALLERPLPELCADRLDYFLRDGAGDIGLFSVAEARELLTHLRVWEAGTPARRIVVDDRDAARWLGEQFIRLDDSVWCSVQEVGWYAVMAEALRAALNHGVLAEADFAGADAALMARLRATAQPEVQRWLALLRPEVDFARVTTGADLVALPKVRAIDPPVWIGTQVQPLSQLDAEFAQRRAAYIASKQGHWGLKIIAG